MKMLAHFGETRYSIDQFWGDILGMRRGKSYALYTMRILVHQRQKISEIQ